MKRILACIDFSDVTPAVIETAATLARGAGAALVTAHVVIIPISLAWDDPTGALAREQAVGERVRQARVRLTGLIEHLRWQYGLHITTLVLEGFQAAPLLIQECGRQNPDLIVAGSHGHSPLGRLLLGSTSQDLIRLGTWPVLVIPRAKEGGKVTMPTWADPPRSRAAARA